MTQDSEQVEATDASTLPAEFTFETHAVRTMMRDGHLWFILTDVCDILGLTNPSKAVADFDDDERV